LEDALELWRTLPIVAANASDPLPMQVICSFAGAAIENNFGILGRPSFDNL